MADASSASFFVSDASVVIWGEIVDRKGARACVMGGSLTSIVGMLLTSLAVSFRRTTTPGDVVTTVGIVLMGIAGPGIFDGVYIGMLNLPGTTRTAFFEAALSTFVAGCFDLSSLVFALFEAVQSAWRVPLHSSFLAWAFVCAVLMYFTLAWTVPPGELPPSGPTAATDQPAATEASNLLPGRSDGQDGAPASLLERGKSYGSSVLEAATGGRSRGAPEQGKAAGAGALGAKASPLLVDGASDALTRPAARAGFCGDLYSWLQPAINATCTVHNLLLVLQMGVLNLANSHYITAHEIYLGLMLGSEVGNDVSRLFDVGFPIIGFASTVPVTALLMSRRTWLPFLVLASYSTLWMVMTLVPTLGTQYAAALLFGPLRTLMWASYYRIQGTNTELYDPDLVGRTIGYNGIFVALIGDAVAPLLMAYAQSDDVDRDEQSARFTQIRIGLLVAIVITTFALPAYLYLGSPCSAKRVVAS